MGRGSLKRISVHAVRLLQELVCFVRICTVHALIGCLIPELLEVFWTPKIRTFLTL